MPAQGSRRDFLAKASGLAAAASVSGAISPNVFAAVSATDEELSPIPTERVSLDGCWQFQLDPRGRSEDQYLPQASASGWMNVVVPHTWQTNGDSAEYYGVAWYRREFEAPVEWAADKTVRLEFEAVFHSATVWVNKREAGRHLRKGYTAFSFNITPLLHFGGMNEIVVKVSNTFDDAMLPRAHSSDWTHDGGIYRPVSLLVTPKVYVERVDVDSVPDLKTKSAELRTKVVVCNSGADAWKGQITYRAIDNKSGLPNLAHVPATTVALKAGETSVFELPVAIIPNVKLWHFDHPHLYTLIATLSGTGSSHRFTTVFGVRSIEVRDAAFYLNRERVRLMGVERMAGSNPQFGMAEPSSWIEHDHRDMNELNCVFTRVHWPQDKRVLDYCDRHGILIQTEVPTWGPDTFADMKDEPSPEIMQNGLEQLREMVERDRNHPCIFSWGLCNEIGGQNPPAHKFAKRMYEEAKKIDPTRLCSYASNSLQTTPEKDVSALMDFIEWNEYYETWYRGTPENFRRNLDEIHKAFPDKPIVLSEYGYCACTVDRPEGDSRRIEILREHTRVARNAQYVSGLIFFCYNDYRTHIGDRGTGVLKQRIHGVVDLFGAQKPSYAVLRNESSPIESIEIKGQPSAFSITVRTRNSIPAYVLSDYILRGVLYGFGDIPLETREAAIPELALGQAVSIPMHFSEAGATRIVFEVIRPTGFSTRTQCWKP